MVAKRASLANTMAMLVPRIDRIEIDHLPHASRGGSRLWREWCFARVALRHFQRRFLIMVAILAGGGLMFVIFEPEKNHSFPRAVFYTWLLIFGEPPEEFPTSNVLRAMFFIMPVLGLTVIIEGIIDFALMLRDRRRYERSWCTMLASSFKNHIVLVGFGKLGYRIFQLLRKLGEAVVVIERDASNQFLEELRRDGSPLLVGDARRESLLAEANVAHARSIILATNDDMANLEIALDARQINAAIRVVVRMFDQNLADKMSGLSIHMAMSQAALSAPTFATSAVAPSIVGSFVVGNKLVVMQRWLVRREGPLCGLTVGDVMRRHQIGIVEHSSPHGKPVLYPPAETVLEPGDGLILQGPLNVLSGLWRENTGAVATPSPPVAAAQ